MKNVMRENEIVIDDDAKVQEWTKRADSMLRDLRKEEFFIFKRGTYNPETGEIEGSKSFYSLKECVDEFYKHPRKERRNYGIWDAGWDMPLNLEAAREGKRIPDIRYGSDGSLFVRA